MKKIFYLISIFIVSFIFIEVKADSPIAMYIEKGDSKETIKEGDIVSVNYVLDCFVGDRCSSFSPINGGIAIFYDSNVFGIVEEENYGFVNSNLIMKGIGNYNSNMIPAKDQSLTYNFEFLNNFRFPNNSKVIVASVKFKVKKDLITQDTLIYSHDMIGKITCNNYPDYGNVGVCGADRGLKLNYHINGKSEDSSLKSLDINTGSLIPNFSSQNKDYVVNVDYNISSIKISGVANNSNAKITGLGEKKLNFGKNVFEILCKAESGAESKYTITINRATDKRSSDSQLKEVVIKDDKSSDIIAYDFVATQYDYEIDVPYNVKKINMEVKTNDEKAKFTVPDNLNLEVGKNEVLIKVQAENGTETTYKYIITRTKEDKVKLTNLRIFGYELSPNFTSDNLEYNINYNGEEDSLKILYETDNDLVKVDIVGNDDLKKNPKDVKINVVGENNDNKVTYTIHLNEVKHFNFLYAIIAILSIIVCLLVGFIIYDRKKYHNNR